MNLPERNNEPMQDEIIAEVRRIRDELAAEFDYDLDRLFEEMKRREQASDRPKIEPSPKRLPSAA